MLKLPILDMLLRYQDTSPLSFHVPGHRNGLVLDRVTKLLQERSSEHHVDDLERYIDSLQLLMKLDVTEIDITDDLHDPQYAIRVAQQRAAVVFKSKHTFFLVGGSTSGNIASILATCEPNDYIIVQRNVHKSVINGCKLAGVNVVFISPQVDEQSGYSTIPSLDLLDKAIKQYPYAKAVFFTSPNYYGISHSLTHYVELIHRNNMLFIVDEAHGAHYGFHGALPQSALSYGADLVVQSTHKTLPSITMSAMLHVNSENISIEYIQEQLAMIESSSPSFLMLASLDLATAIIENSGYNFIEQSLSILEKLTVILNNSDMRLGIEEYVKSCGQFNISYDPLRLHIYDKLGQYTGYDLLKLFNQYGIWPEMATSKHCIFVLHLGYTEKEYEMLLLRLNEINSNELSQPITTSINAPIERVSSYYNNDAIGEPILMSRLTPKTTKLVSIDEAMGCVSGETLVPYPPGIPILYKGEKVSAEIIHEINHFLHYGARFQANETLESGKIKIIVN